jgi:hypothetical protein
VMTLTNIFNDKDTHHYCDVVYVKLNCMFPFIVADNILCSRKSLMMLSSRASDRSITNGLVVFMY